MQFYTMTPEIVLERVTNFVEHLQREDHFDDAKHQANLPALEKEFHDNNFGPPRNQYLSVRPRYFYERGSDEAYLWGKKIRQSLPDERVVEEIQREAVNFKTRFETDVQFVFSHVQHHWHILDEDKQGVLMPYCRPKGLKPKWQCKQGLLRKAQ